MHAYPPWLNTWKSHIMKSSLKKKLHTNTRSQAKAAFFFINIYIHLLSIVWIGSLFFATIELVALIVSFVYRFVVLFPLNQFDRFFSISFWNWLRVSMRDVHNQSRIVKWSPFMLIWVVNQLNRCKWCANFVFFLLFLYRLMPLKVLSIQSKRYQNGKRNKIYIYCTLRQRNAFFILSR